MNALLNCTNCTTIAVPECDVDTEFFPCSTFVWANILLILMYGYILARAAKLLADGSELLLDILDPGLIGGFVLPLLGALPDGAIVVLSVLSSDPVILKEEIKVGMGTLAGSTIMLLTIAWTGGVFLGRCDISEKGEAIDSTLTQRWNFLKTGVTCDDDVKMTSRIMAGTSLSYLVILIVALVFYGKTDAVQLDNQEEFALAGFISCTVFFIAYSIWSVCNIKRQEKQIVAAQEKIFIQNVETALMAEVEKIEEKLDNKQSKRKLDIQRGDDESYTDDDVLHISESGPLLGTINAIKATAHGVGSAINLNPHDHGTTVEDVKEIVKLIEEDIEQDESDREVLTKKQILIRAPIMLIVGAAILSAFSDPMVKAITNFSLSIKISPFYTSFIVVPFASNASELIASLLFAYKKKKKNISLTFGAIYGAVIMNSTFILGVFLGFFYFKHILFTFYAEVITTLTVIFAMGALSSFKTTFHTYWSFIVILLYPLSILMVYLLGRAFGET
jgi:Ca2+/Na+ antiporter